MVTPLFSHGAGWEYGEDGQQTPAYPSVLEGTPHKERLVPGHTSEK